MTMQDTARMLARYSTWANKLFFAAVAALPPGEATKARTTLFQMHIVNHTSYHRGFAADLFYQVPARPPTTDLPVYLRDAHTTA